MLRDFGFALPQLSPQLFLDTKKLVRMGVPPVRIAILTEISGVTFAECYVCRVMTAVEGVRVNVIGVDDFKINKRASGRHKDSNDLERL